MSNLVDANEEQNKIKIILLRVKYNNTLSWRVNFVIKSDPGTLDEALISRKILDILIGYFFSKSKIKRKTLYTFIKNNNNNIKLEAKVRNSKTGEIIEDLRDSEYLELYNFCENWKENYIKKYGNIFN